jgi:hypothetical protein
MLVAAPPITTAEKKHDSRALDIKEKELAMKDHHATLTDLADRTQEVANKAADATMQGVQDAKEALQAQQEAAQQPPPNGAAM